MKTNTNVTVWNKYYNPVTRLEEWKRTELKGVMLIASKGVNVMKSGLETADAVKIIISKYVDTNLTWNQLTETWDEADWSWDAVTKTYKTPKQWQATPNIDMSKYWTLQTGDKVANGLINFDIDATHTMKMLEATYDEVYTITSVDNLNFGTQPHWEVGGR